MDCFFSLADLLEANSLPTLDDIMSKRDNPECFFLFCDYFLSRVVGISVWKEGCLKTKVSQMATASDEAFALLLVENYWESWSKIDLDQYKIETTFDVASNRKRKRKTTWGKYTKSAYGARRYAGWMAEGLLRFNELFEEVKADRLKNGEAVEELYINHCVSNHSSPKKFAKVKNRDVIAICEDLTEDL